VHGKGRLAAIAFFVFAVLYVFSNEVSLRVARTVSRRLKRLSAKIENGQEEIDEKDMKYLNGWRWRVLFWNH
jgi:cob(I)alamin adenosyltransferase